MYLHFLIKLCNNILGDNKKFVIFLFKLSLLRSWISDIGVYYDIKAQTLIFRFNFFVFIGKTVMSFPVCSLLRFLQFLVLAIRDLFAAIYFSILILLISLWLTSGVDESSFYITIPSHFSLKFFVLTIRMGSYVPPSSVLVNRPPFNFG